MMNNFIDFLSFSDKMISEECATGKHFSVFCIDTFVSINEG